MCVRVNVPANLFTAERRNTTIWWELRLPTERARRRRTACTRVLFTRKGDTAAGRHRAPSMWVAGRRRAGRKSFGVGECGLARARRCTHRWSIRVWAFVPSVSICPLATYVWLCEYDFTGWSFCCRPRAKLCSLLAKTTSNNTIYYACTMCLSIRRKQSVRRFDLFMFCLI